MTLKSVANAALTQLPDATCSTWGDPKTAVAPEGNPPSALIHRNALAPLCPSAPEAALMISLSPETISVLVLHIALLMHR